MVRTLALSTLVDGVAITDPTHAFRILDDLPRSLNAGEVNDEGMLRYRVERLFAAPRALPDVDRAALARREFAYLPLLTGPGRREHSLVLFDIMASDPSNFVEALKLLFRFEGSDRGVLEKGDETKARAAYNLLESFHRVPGVSDAGIDAAAMARWVRTALEGLAASGRLDVGAFYIGKLMAHAPHDPEDGAWPAVALREIIEREALDVAAKDVVPV